MRLSVCKSCITSVPLKVYVLSCSCFGVLALLASALSPSASSQVNNNPGGVTNVTLDDWKSDCANHAVDNLEQDPRGVWCYIRMYRCTDKGKWVPWWSIDLHGLKNSNTGDVLWAAKGGSDLEQRCSSYGQYLEVWRVAVKRDLMVIQDSAHSYSECNDRSCDKDTFGWRYLQDKAWFFGQSHHRKERGWEFHRKRQFSLPLASRGSEWRDGCLERVINTRCLATLTYDKDLEDSVIVATFKRDVLDNPIEGCQSLSAVKECSPVKRRFRLTLWAPWGR